MKFQIHAILHKLRSNMSQFVQNVKYPPEFPGLLMDLCREVLREQPDNIYEFAVKHFTQLRDAMAAEKARRD
ncbi:Regulatory subunit of type II PKA R-subunit [Giardia duodenalis assemblage B]|uniref:Regulatory subunit of type II PKA R-subunit n=1 Tax=Giardia duodenalis assemblage B TaxID=1394984 RepID=A0A132P1Q2_GIAIN|nr:Regulatory subunit of type II PKA R-subunit [Giardia intestinalis assemblage B]